MSRETKTFVAIAAAHFLADCYGGIWPVYKYLANLDLARAGTIATVTMMIGTASQPLFGLWADAGHRRLFIVVGAALTLPAMLLGLVALHADALGATLAYGLMFVILLVVRLGQGMFHPAGAGIAGATAGRGRSSRFAVFIAAGGVGFAVSQLLFSSAYIASGAHVEWLLIPGAAAVVGVAAWCRPGDLPRENRPTLRQLVGGLAHARGPLINLFAILSLVYGLNVGLHFLLPEFCELRGYPRWFSDGGAFLLVVMGSVLVMVPAGHLADRFGRRRLLIVTLAASAGLYYLFVLAPPLHPAAFAALCLVAGAALGTSNPLGVAFGQQLAARASVSTISALLMGLAWTVGSVSQSIVGKLAELPAVGVRDALLWLGITGVGALVWSFFLPRDTADAG